MFLTSSCYRAAHGKGIVQATNNFDNLGKVPADLTRAWQPLAEAHAKGYDTPSAPMLVYDALILFFLQRNCNPSTWMINWWNLKSY